MKRYFLTLLLQCMVFWSFGQFTLKGIVSAKNGDPLPGANIMINNSFYATRTDANGSFQFDRLAAGNYQLLISYLGFEKKTLDVQLSADFKLEIVLQQADYLAEEVLVSANRLGEKAPIAFSGIGKDAIKNRNSGQDIPYLLALSPSFVATSDAGTGIGYTNFRIRGTDMNRINVTLNGIPMNDAESHGTWWVDVPDIASSTEHIQIQRGVGTSSNGAAAFGGTINLQTNTVNKEAFAEFNSFAGSFGSFKNSIAVGSGILKEKFSFDARLSKVVSNGFIDRASADLQSFFVSGTYSTTKTFVKVNVFSGIEDTYQAWNGVPSVRLNNDSEGIQRYADHWLYTQKQVDEMKASDHRTYNLYTYENEIDHYKQNHYQLLFTHTINESLNANVNLFYTAGKGYYEQYKEDQDFTDYLIVPPTIGGETIESADLIRRKWLENDFFGITFAMVKKIKMNDFTFGGGYNIYDGNHFGTVIWSEFAGNAPINHEWYRSTGLKKDFNLFAKYNYQLTDQLNLLVDFQYRKIDYQIVGNDDDLRDLLQSHKFDFLNPKVGIFYEKDQVNQYYVNFSRANREPNRDNYVDADPDGRQPEYETLNDFEAGYKYRSASLAFNLNGYFMYYQNQLIITGEINDVGAPVMTNVDKSYRAGLELIAGVKISPKLKWDLNLTFSKNKVMTFTEFVDDWDTGDQQQFEIGTSDLAFSPEIIGNSQLSWIAAKGLTLDLMTYSVSKQYIDNSRSEDRKLDGYLVNNLKLTYQLKQHFAKSMNLHLMVNNLFDAEYESNAWVYSYLLEGKRFAMDGHFPQAGINFMAGIEIRF